MKLLKYIVFLILAFPTIAHATLTYIDGDEIRSYSRTVNMVLPTTAGTSGYFMQTDGAGNLTWAPGSSPLTFTLPLVNTSDVISIIQSDSSHNGFLSSVDWNTFNGKQAAGNYITALTGDGAASGPGSSALTLATVNSNVGTFGSSTSIPTFTVNAKGLITAASGNAVIAPAGTLTGTALNTTVVDSSLTSVGTIVTGVWNGTEVDIAHGGTGETSFTTGSVPFIGATTFDEDNTNFNWDNTGKTLALGGVEGPPGTVPYAFTAQRTIVNPSGIDGSIFGIHYSNNSVNNGSLNASGYFEARTQIDTGVSSAANAGVIFQAYRNAGSSDAGSLAYLIGAFGGSHQIGTDAAAITDLVAGVMSQVDITNGQANRVADFYGLSGTNGGTINTGQFGVYIEPPASGMKDNWFSGQAEIGGTSYSSHGDTLKVNGDLSATTSVTDSGTSAAIFSATSNTTTDASNTTIGINGVATGLVQSGATNDKALIGTNFAITRGDGTDQGILQEMDGVNVLLFGNSDTSGVTNKAFGYQTAFFSEKGTVTDLYDFFSQRIPAGTGVVTNHWGVYITNDNDSPVVNYLSGRTQIGGSSPSIGDSASLDLKATDKAFIVNRIDTTTRDGLTAVNGMIIYNTTNDELECYQAGAWGVCAAGGGGGGANTTLSNLGTTAINANLNPDTDLAYTLGQGALRWADVRTNSIGVDILYSSAGGFGSELNLGSTLDYTPAGPFTITTKEQTDTSSSSQVFNINTGSVDDPTSTGAAGSIFIQPGNQAGTGSVGDVQITGGNGSTGGQVKIKAGAASAEIDITPTGISLKDEAGIDAITIGSAARTLADHTAVISVDFDARELQNPAGLNVLDWSDADEVQIISHIATDNTSGATTVSACGTTPNISGSDSAGTITIGAGVVTSCTVTFANTWTSTVGPPKCFVNDQTTTIATRATPTTTQVVLSGAFVAGDLVDYFCIGYQ